MITIAGEIGICADNIIKKLLTGLLTGNVIGIIEVVIVQISQDIGRTLDRNPEKMILYHLEKMIEVLIGHLIGLSLPATEVAPLQP